MATAARTESLESQPAVKATSSNKQLMQKNQRVTENWLKARRALDREKREFEAKVGTDKNTLLKQRERLHSVSFSLDTVRESDSTSSTPRGPIQSEKRRMTLADVYDSLMKSVREQNSNGNDTRSIQSEPHLSKTSTTSFDNKKVTRKPVRFSLQGLQRAHSNLQEKLEALNQTPDVINTESLSEPATPRGFFDLSESELNLGPKLHLPPTSLPPIRSQSVFKPRSRSFDRRAGPATTPDNVEDIQYCRYIRGSVKGLNRRNSAPSTRHGVKRHVNRIK